MTLHRLTISGDATFMRRIRDVIREQHDAIVAEESWTVTEAGGVLEFNTTDWRMVMNTPIVVMTDVQVDAVQISDPEQE